MSLAEIKERAARIAANHPTIWVGDDGKLRRGHSGDMIEMLDRLNIPTIS